MDSQRGVLMSGVFRFGGEVNPTEAWERLASNESAALIDVRTNAEWAFVGVPDLGSIKKSAALLPWKQYPDMRQNDEFLEAARAIVLDQSARDVFFLCRSGGRSMQAARFLEGSESGQEAVTLWNVAEGFEGDLDDTRRRGRKNGWKARGLPWVQA